MTVTDTDNDLRAVEQDLQDAFRKLCPPAEKNGHPEPFVTPQLAVTRDPVVSGDVKVVPWECTISAPGKVRFLGRSVQQIDDVKLRGLTFIRGEPPNQEFYRYIDWLPFLTSLGLLAAVRPENEHGYDLNSQRTLLRTALQSQIPPAMVASAPAAGRRPTSDGSRRLRLLDEVVAWVRNQRAH